MTHLVYNGRPEMVVALIVSLAEGRQHYSEQQIPICGTLDS